MNGSIYLKTSYGYLKLAGVLTFLGVMIYYLTQEITWIYLFITLAIAAIISYFVKIKQDKEAIVVGHYIIQKATKKKKKSKR